MLTAIFVIIGLSLLILGHEAGHFFVAKLFKLRVDEFGFGFPPRMLAKRKGETEYSLNWLPFGGFVKIAGENDRLNGGLGKLKSLPEEEKNRLFCFQSWWKRSVVLLAGVAVNFLLGWFLISAVLMIGTPRALVISQVQQNSPAAKIGLLEGDVIRNYVSADEFIKYINQNRGEQIILEVRRGGEDLNLSIVPRINVPPGEGALGIALAEVGEGRKGFFPAIAAGLKQSALICRLVLTALYQLVKNLFLHGSLLQGIVGPVGIFSVAQETGHIGLIYLVQLVSLISLNLAVVNLIPFPALDGGRFFLILIEKIKGSPVSYRTETIVNSLGFAFLLFLMALLTIRDVGRLF
jgi:regulator of sigma E protease